MGDMQPELKLKLKLILLAIGLFLVIAISEATEFLSTGHFISSKDDQMVHPLVCAMLLVGFISDNARRPTEKSKN